MMNLVTSCIDCNLGKSDKVLSDHSALEKQRAQLDQLSERREQLSMMMQWRDGLEDIQKMQLSIAIERFNKMLPDSVLSKTGETNLGKVVKAHGLENVLNHMQTAYDKAAKNNSGIPDVTATFKNIGKLISVQGMDHVERNARYICGILRNKFGYIDTPYYLKVLTSNWNEVGLQGFINDLMLNKIRSLKDFDRQIDNPF